MSKSLEKLNVGRKYDRRIKMIAEDIAEAIRLRKEDQDRWSYQKLADRFGVSKRLIIFRIRPETLEKVLEARRERGGYHTDTAKQTIYMRNHRRYKRELRNEGKI
jgi:AraC-like DNA-binding protein